MKELWAASQLPPASPLTSAIVKEAAKAAQSPDVTSQAPPATADSTAYVLSISPQGQLFLDQNGDKKELTDTQKSAVVAVLEKYQDAAPTDDNLKQLHDDLQAALAPQDATNTDTKSDAKSDKPAKPPRPPGGGGGISYTDLTSDAEETAKRKIRPQVGSVGADSVVDKQGNIDQAKLKELLQSQAQEAHRFDPKT